MFFRLRSKDIMEWTCAFVEVFIHLWNTHGLVWLPILQTGNWPKITRSTKAVLQIKKRWSNYETAEKQESTCQKSHWTVFVQISQYEKLSEKSSSVGMKSSHPISAEAVSVRNSRPSKKTSANNAVPYILMAEYHEYF